MSNSTSIEGRETKSGAKSDAKWRYP